jgi:hypothetical protein
LHILLYGKVAMPRLFSPFSGLALLVVLYVIYFFSLSSSII